MDVDKILVGKRINVIRKEKGLTMEAFGSLIDGASKGLVNNWEKGVNLPNAKRLKLIANAGGISVNELLYGSLESYCYSIFLNIENEVSDKGFPTPPAYYLSMMKIKNEVSKIENAFRQGLGDVEKRNLSYEDKNEIERIMKNSIERITFHQEYTNAGAISFSIDYLRLLYENEILNYFYYDDAESENGIRNQSSVTSLNVRKNVSPELYDEIQEIVDEAIGKLEKLIEKFPNE